MSYAVACRLVHDSPQDKIHAHLKAVGDNLFVGVQACCLISLPAFLSFFQTIFVYFILPEAP